MNAALKLAAVAVLALAVGVGVVPLQPRRHQRGRRSITIREPDPRAPLRCGTARCPRAPM